MTQQPQAGAVPEWTLGWRMQRALGFAHLSVEQMAAELDVSRSTISRWMNDRGAPPRRSFLRLWALRCGVSLDWLSTGVGTHPDPSTGLEASEQTTRAKGHRSGWTSTSAGSNRVRRSRPALALSAA